MVSASHRPLMIPLDNPADSPCFGCGPKHPRGLHLSFARRGGDGEAEEVISDYVPKSDEIGWPGLMHIGLLFMVMMETSYWAALTLTGKVMTVSGPTTFETIRLPRVGIPFRTRAHVASRGPSGVRILCSSEGTSGKSHATLQSDWRPASRSAAERAGLSLPAYLLEDMEP
jgi:hypothetical protein